MRCECLCTLVTEWVEWRLGVLSVDRHSLMYLTPQSPHTQTIWIYTCKLTPAEGDNTTGQLNLNWQLRAYKRCYRRTTLLTIVVYSIKRRLQTWPDISATFSLSFWLSHWWGRWRTGGSWTAVCLFVKAVKIAGVQWDWIHSNWPFLAFAYSTVSTKWRKSALQLLQIRYGQSEFRQRVLPVR